MWRTEVVDLLYDPDLRPADFVSSLDEFLKVSLWAVLRDRIVYPLDNWFMNQRLENIKDEASDTQEEFSRLQTEITTAFKSDLSFDLKQAEGSLSEEISTVQQDIRAMSGNLDRWAVFVSCVLSPPIIMD